MKTAKLIGETTGGMTAVEIYDDDQLVWSHGYFGNGATKRGYIEGLCQVLDDMINCEDVEDYDGCDRDYNGDVILHDTCSTTGIIAEYCAGKWTLTDDYRRYGQSVELIDALMLIKIIQPDSEHEDWAQNSVAVAIAKKLSE